MLDLRSKAPYLLVIAAAILVSLPVYGFRWHLWLHVLGAVVFLGNIIVSAAWMSTAKRAGSVSVVAFAARMVARADWMFTAPGVVLVLLNGFALAAERYGGWSEFQEVAWIAVALYLFVLSGVVWGAVLVRYQTVMVRLSAEAAHDGTELPPAFHRALARWFAWGGLATALPLFSLYLMVAKPTLWD